MSELHTIELTPEQIADARKTAEALLEDQEVERALTFIENFYPMSSSMQLGLLEELRGRENDLPDEDFSEEITLLMSSIERFIRDVIESKSILMPIFY
jgi:hypothetical protein